MNAASAQLQIGRGFFFAGGAARKMRLLEARARLSVPGGLRGRARRRASCREHVFACTGAEMLLFESVGARISQIAGATEQASAPPSRAIDSPYVPRDAREQPIDLRPLEVLLARIEEKYRPEQIWLFGSRARGDAGATSDWDLFVVVPDDTDERELDPMTAWRLQRGSGVPADVIPCSASDFQNASDTVNTLSYVVATEGVLIRSR